MLLVVSIDGATPELVERLTSTGQMPALRSLMRHGVYGRLQSAANTDPICAWSSVLTGVNPGKHGVWALHNLVPKSYQWRAANSRMLRVPSLSQLLADRGRSVGTFFVPMTYPAPEAEWVTVSGWLAPSSDDEAFAYPRRVRDLVRRSLKESPLHVDARHHAAAGSYEDGVEEAVAALRAKASVAEKLLDDGRWDVFAISFSELGRILRWYWHLFDRNHLDFRDDLHAAHGKLLTVIHREIDAVIGRLLDLLGPDDQVLVISPYGTSLNSRVASCLPELMAYLGLLRTRSSARGWWHSVATGVSRGAHDFLSVIREVLPEGIAEMLPESEDDDDRRGNSEDAWLDYERSSVIPAPGGQMHLNLMSEFPLGCVDPGQVDRLKLQVIGALQTAIDPATGRRPLEWAQPRERVCSGPYVDRIPHIVTRWRSPHVVTGLTATGLDGRVRVARPSGGHFPSGTPGAEGIIVAAGAGIRRGARIEGARVEDITATIMYLAGEGVPGYLDGRVLEQAVTQRWRADHPIRIFDRSLPRVVEDHARIEEASRAVEACIGGPGEEP